MKSSLVSVVYKSRACKGAVNYGTFDEILKVSQRNNVKHQITGALTHVDGHFIQVIEGAPDAVADAVERIRADARHSHLDVRGPVDIGQRRFPDWSMASALCEPDLHFSLSEILTHWDTSGLDAVDLIARALGEEADMSR